MSRSVYLDSLGLGSWCVDNAVSRRTRVHFCSDAYAAGVIAAALLIRASFVSLGILLVVIVALVPASLQALSVGSDDPGPDNIDSQLAATLKKFKFSGKME